MPPEMAKVELSVRPATPHVISVAYPAAACASEGEGCGKISASASEVKVGVLRQNVETTPVVAGRTLRLRAVLGSL